MHSTTSDSRRKAPQFAANRAIFAATYTLCPPVAAFPFSFFDTFLVISGKSHIECTILKSYGSTVVFHHYMSILHSCVHLTAYVLSMFYPASMLYPASTVLPTYSLAHIYSLAHTYGLHPHVYFTFMRPPHSLCIIYVLPRIYALPVCSGRLRCWRPSRFFTRWQNG